MGQYYKIIFLDGAGKILYWITPYFPYNCGIKLTEHCYLNNPVCTTVEYLLCPLGKHYKGRIVWAGDCANDEADEKLNLYTKADDLSKLQYTGYHKTTDVLPFIVNHSKKLFVDKRKKFYINNTLPIHPLPFLTCEGNGASGSDIDTSNPLAGSWARDVLSVERDVPSGYEELVIESEGHDEDQDSEM
jgi:hypothetical protein